MIGRIPNRLTRLKATLGSKNLSSRFISGQKSSTSFSSGNRHIKTSCIDEPRINFNLKKDVQIMSDDYKLNTNQLAGSNVSLEDLEFYLAGRRFIFNLTWLRDSCHCSSCTHKHSRQRLFTPKNFSRNIFQISEVKILDSIAHEPTGPGDLTKGLLSIKWGDGHQSEYSLRWLIDYYDLYKSMNLQLHASQKPIYQLPHDDFYSPVQKVGFETHLWTVPTINANLRPVDYNDLVDGFIFHDDEPTFINANSIEEMSPRRYEALKNLTEHLTRFGLAKVNNVPTERNQVLRLARSMAYERPTGYGTIFDVVVEPSEEINLAYSTQEFDLHSDLTYRETSPGVQLLHCIRDSDEGGLSYFSDAFNAAQMLKNTNPILYEVLLQFPATFVVRDPYRNIKFRRQKTILSLNYQGELEEVYYSPFMLPPVGFIEDVKLFYLALDEFTQLLQSEENKLITKMKPSDLFIFHNRRVLHGRSSYETTNSNRFLQGCYMDWDEISCLHEKLVSNKPQLSH